MRRAAVIVLTFLSLALAASGAAGSPGAARPVVLVAMGSLREPSLRALAEHFRHEFHVRVIVRASVPRPANAYNSSRKQYAGEKLVRHLERIYRNGIVIAVTDQDIYMATRPFVFVFSVRDQRAALVSSARMNPGFYGLPADRELLSSRLEKMVAKMIGVLAFGRRESSDPRSTLYGSILGVDDLDFMTEQFTPRPYGAEKRAWLAAADAACNKARADTAALGATPVQTTGDILTVVGRAIELENGLLSSISSLKPAHADAALVAKLRSSFAQAIAADRATLASLTAHWDPQRFKQWTTDNQAAGFGLKATALRLGSRQCAAYFGS